MKITKSPIQLIASSRAVITQFLHLPGKDRIEHILAREHALSENQVNDLVDTMRSEFSERHRDIEDIWMRHFDSVATIFPRLKEKSRERQWLIGGLFTKEYSIQSAALFNPSIVEHPDQSDLPPGQLRFLMSLRATGEGHISSIVFQTGILDKKGNIFLEKSSGYFTALRKDENKKWNEEDADANYNLADSSDIPINEKVIFPLAKAESMGMEDLRLVRFKENDRTCYYGTYTAYNGKEIRTQLLETEDFHHFAVRTLSGEAIQDKGMALFPEKINGRYAMISRQGGEKIHLMYSNDLYSWNKFSVLLEPAYSWEIVQMGNCGSPVKTDQGWLLLIHGVGVMRTYVISALLLDLKDPSKVLKRLDKPLIKADESEREGYVPNVVYTCGLLIYGHIVLIPYAMSDAATGFATIDLTELLNEMR